MPARSKSRGSWNEDSSCYAQTWQWAIVRMAVDHFFKDVVEGNVPLANVNDKWWEAQVVGSQVTKYHANWALLFEGLAMFRSAMDDSVPHQMVQIDESLGFTYRERRGGDEPITWEAEDARR